MTPFFLAALAVDSATQLTISIATLVTVATAIGGLIWRVAKFAGKIEDGAAHAVTQDLRITGLETRVDAVEKNSNEILVSLAEIKTHLSWLRLSFPARPPDPH